MHHLVWPITSNVTSPITPNGHGTGTEAAGPDVARRGRRRRCCEPQQGCNIPRNPAGEIRVRPSHEVPAL